MIIRQISDRLQVTEDFNGLYQKYFAYGEPGIEESVAIVTTERVQQGEQSQEQCS